MNQVFTSRTHEKCLDAREDQWFGNARTVSLIEKIWLIAIELLPRKHTRFQQEKNYNWWNFSLLQSMLSISEQMIACKITTHLIDALIDALSCRSSVFVIEQ